MDLQKPPISLSILKQELEQVASPEKAKALSSYFKTGPGEYGEGDRFLGLTVPVMRSWAKRAQNLNFNDLDELLQSPWHEHRFVALEILVFQFQNQATRAILDFYEAHLNRVNNWDLVDTSAPYLWGHWLTLHPKDEPELKAHLKSHNMWERRVAIVALLGTLKKGPLDRALEYAKILLNDPEDLIHKASGWVLREVGKIDAQKLQDFLEENAAQMPRTMLRYAIERFPEEKRKKFLAIKKKKQ